MLLTHVQQDLIIRALQKAIVNRHKGARAASRQTRGAMTAGQPELYKRGFSAGYTACGGGREVGR